MLFTLCDQSETAQQRRDKPLEMLRKLSLAGIGIQPWDRNDWKTKAWSLGEQIGWELWELTTRQYFR